MTVVSGACATITVEKRNVLRTDHRSLDIAREVNSVQSRFRRSHTHKTLDGIPMSSSFFPGRGLALQSASIVRAICLKAERALMATSIACCRRRDLVSSIISKVSAVIFDSKAIDIYAGDDVIALRLCPYSSLLMVNILEWRKKTQLTGINSKPSADDADSFRAERNVPDWNACKMVDTSIPFSVARGRASRRVLDTSGKD